jgi:hypothetical protein
MLLAMISLVEVSTFGYYACPFTHQSNSPFTLAGSKGIHVLWTHSSILSSYLCQKLKWALLTEKCLTSISLKLFTFTTSSDHCIPMPVIKLSTIVPLGVRGHEVSLLLFKTLDFHDSRRPLIGWDILYFFSTTTACRGTRFARNVPLLRFWRNVVTILVWIESQIAALVSD